MNRAHQRESARQWRAENRDHMRRRRAEERDHHLEYARRWRAENRNHHLEYARRWRAENRDYHLEYARRWGREHPDRRREIARCRHARKRNATIGDIPRDAEHQLLGFQGGRCAYCHEVLAEFHMDHVVPLARGGTHEWANLVLACPRCNQSKHMKLPDEWLPHL